uniref:Peptidase A2 domain-containing protein n=2 Tax=Trichuris muris TaxID=70415 RepID=A0A5S6QFN5_TRIMR
MIGLRLTGAAFEVYDQMAPEDQGKLDKVRERLLTAFAPDPFIAYDELITRRLRDRETADAFLAALRQLALPAGGVSERVMTSIFVRGLPEQIQDALRAGARMETLTLDKLLSRARAMLAKGPSDWNGNLAIVAASSSSSPEARVSGTVLRCYASLMAAGRSTKEGDERAAVGLIVIHQEDPKTFRETKAGRVLRRRALPSLIKALPSVWIQVDGVDRRALVDSGCTSCVVHAPCCRRWSKQPTSLYTISGDKLRCAGVGTATLELREGHAVEVDVIVSEQKPLGFDLVLGIHAIQRLGGMFLDHQGDVQLGPLNAPICASAHAEIRVEGAEFVAAYEPTLKSWKAAWKWANGCAPTILHNTKEEYPPLLQPDRPTRKN